MMLAEVKDNPEKSRYELELERGMAVALYRKGDGHLVVYHSEVPREVEGRGIGSTLVRGMLDDMRVKGLKIVPRCGFVAAFIRRHPAYQDLLAAS
jgi:predicted GNAT family acetyltransferase